jgi:LCP family protein required for cell wall assembly
MVRQGPPGRSGAAGDDERATTVFPAVNRSGRPAGFDDAATDVFAAVGRPHRYADDTPTEVFRPVRPRATDSGVGPTPPGRGHTRRPAPPRRKRPSAVFRVFRVLAIVLVLVLAGAGGMAYGIQTKLGNGFGRIANPFGGLENRPVAAVPEALNVLLVGSDSRTSGGNAGKWVAGDQRTDSMMVVHVAKDRKSIDVVSIPRDSWVDIPGNGKGKINSAYAIGGPPLLIQTIEQLTGVRIDHMAIVDFTGFKDMTDALGGVTITVPKTTGDERNHFEAGTHHMNGKEALGYVRQRHNLPGGDFDRMKRQQNWIRAVIKQAMSRDTLTSPTKLIPFLQAATKSVTLDSGWSTGDLTDLALSLKSIQTRDIHFLTAPNVGSDMEGDQSIVRLDDVNGPALWSAIATDQTTAWLQANKPEMLGDTVN